MHRRTLLAGLAVPFVARAQGRSVRVIVAYGAGGTADATARILFAKLNEVLGQQFVVENRPGAAGTIAAQAVARATPDGATLLHDATAFSVNPTLFAGRLPYDPRRDFAPVFHAMVTPSTLLAHNGFAPKGIAELVALAKAEPGRLDCGSPGIGSLQHMSLELFNRLAGVRINHVPYREVAAGRNDMVAGRIPIMFSNVPGSMLFLNNGQARTLGHGGEAPVALLPGVEAIGASVPGFASYEWNGVFAPAGTPAAELRRLNEGLNACIADPDTAAKMAAIGCLVRHNTPAQFAATLDAEMEKWGRIVREGDIRVE